jgi:hypothetical protein
MNLYSLLVYIEHNEDESPKDHLARFEVVWLTCTEDAVDPLHADIIFTILEDDIQIDNIISKGPCCIWVPECERRFLV